MKRKMLGSGLLNVITFASIALIGIAMSGVFVRAYGLAGYGVLVLARLLLPSGLLGLIDFGLPLATSRFLAEAIALRERERAGEVFFIALTGGAILGFGIQFAILCVGMDRTGWLLGLDAADSASFAPIAKATLIGSPLLFIGLMAQAILEGSGRFASVRLTELLTTLAFVVAALAAIANGNSLVAVGMAYLASQLLKSLVLLVAALLTDVYSWPTSIASIVRLAKQFIWFCAALLPGRVASSTMQFLTPALISAVSGPAGTATYDLLQRIPRFTKTTIGMFNSVFLPAAVHLRTADNKSSERVLLLSATRLSLAMGVPITFSGIIFSSDILQFWLGSSANSGWAIYFCIAWVYPMFIVWSAPAGMILIARPDAVLRLSNLGILTCIVFFAIGVALASTLGAPSFVVAWSVAAIGSAFLIMQLAARKFELRFAELLAPLYSIGVALLPSAAMSLALRQVWPIDNLTTLLIQASINGCASATSLWFFYLRPADRDFVLDLMQGWLRGAGKTLRQG